jgi:hypothetical protein
MSDIYQLDEGNVLWILLLLKKLTYEWLGSIVSKSCVHFPVRKTFRQFFISSLIMRRVLRAFLCCSQRHERVRSAAPTITAVCEYPLCASLAFWSLNILAGLWHSKRRPAISSASAACCMYMYFGIFQFILRWNLHLPSLARVSPASAPTPIIL